MEIVQTSFTWSQCAGLTGPLGHYLTPGVNIGLQRSFPANGSLPGTWVCLDYDDVRAPFRLTPDFLVHRDSGGGAPSVSSARCRSTSANSPRVGMRRTGGQIIEILPQLLYQHTGVSFSQY